jgi:hypothetical protein
MTFRFVVIILVPSRGLLVLRDHLSKSAFHGASDLSLCFTLVEEFRVGDLEWSRPIGERESDRSSRSLAMLLLFAALRRG